MCWPNEGKIIHFLRGMIKKLSIAKEELLKSDGKKIKHEKCGNSN